MLAIIPARGGSKGLPGKNIKELNGKPLIAYTIEAAIRSRSISEVVVTTDDIEIADVARKYGASVPFIRPSYLSEDSSSAVDVYLHAVEYMMKTKNAIIEKFVVLLPTAPLRSNKHIDDAVNSFNEEKAFSLVSVYEADIPPSWYYSIDKDNRLHNAGFDNSKELLNRQDNCKYYIPNGAIYILDYEFLRNKRTYYSDDTIPYVMDVDVSIDIDYLIDFQFAEFLLSK